MQLCILNAVTLTTKSARVVKFMQWERHLIVRRTRLLALSLCCVSRTSYHATSRLHRPHEFSAAVWRLIYSAVPFPAFCSVCDVTCVITRDQSLLLLTFLQWMTNWRQMYKVATLQRSDKTAHKALSLLVTKECRTVVTWYEHQCRWSLRARSGTRLKIPNCKAFKNPVI